jgi:hypothetical protein
MTIPPPGAEDGADPRAEQAAPHRKSGEPTQRDFSTADQGARRYEQPEAQLGGADAVEKTTYVVGEGTEPDARPTGRYIARGSAGSGSVIAWVVGAIAALIALVYVIGIFR